MMQADDWPSLSDTNWPSLSGTTLSSPEHADRQTRKAYCAKSVWDDSQSTLRQLAPLSMLPPDPPGLPMPLTSTSFPEQYRVPFPPPSMPPPAPPHSVDLLPTTFQQRLISTSSLALPVPVHPQSELDPEENVCHCMCTVHTNTVSPCPPRLNVEERRRGWAMEIKVKTFNHEPCSQHPTLIQGGAGGNT